HLYDQNAVRPKFVPYDPESPYNDPETEQWAVTKPLYLEQVDLGPDWSRPIKNIANSDLEEYKYIYEKPGTYTAYFVAINSTIDGKKEVITEFTLTITP